MTDHQEEEELLKEEAVRMRPVPQDLGLDVAPQLMSEAYEARAVLVDLGFPTYRSQVLNNSQIAPTKMSEVMKDGYWVYKALLRTETLAFQMEARRTYKPFEPIQGIWHPIYQLECVRINHEHSLYKLQGEPNDS